MEKIKNVVFLGSEEIGKTTLANALLEKDIFPQSYDGVYVPTRVCASHMMAEGIRLTDTPGYSLWWKTVPEEVVEAAAEADTLIVLLDENLAEEAYDLSADPDWEADRAREEQLLDTLLRGKTRDIYFVIPYSREEWGEEPVPLTQALRMARARFARFTDHGGAGFFCIEPMQALEGELWADDEMITLSGIRPLKAKILGEDE